MVEMHPDYSKPFAEVIGVGISHFHPEAYDLRAIERLRRIAQEDPPGEWILEIKSQFIQALERHLEGMDLDELESQVEHSAQTNEIFVRRMWATIFQDEPIPGGPSGPWDATYTIIDIYLGDHDPDENLVHPDHLARQFRRPESEHTPLLRAIRSELIRMLRGDFEGLDMRYFRAMISPRFHGDDKNFARYAWRYLFPDEPLPESTPEPLPGSTPESTPEG